MDEPLRLPLLPPVEPMLAKLTDELPEGDGWIFEPKWDGFRALVFRDGERVYTQSREGKPLDRYFPELAPALRKNLPARCVLDGEIVIVGPGGLDFEALQLRLHPAASRVAKLAAEKPSAFVAFDLLALDDENWCPRPQAERRARLEALLATAEPPVHLTPATRDRALAGEWFTRFEGAGLDGIMAKREEGHYLPGKRAMAKIKHARTADCVVAGFRWHKNGPGTLVGSLLLGLYDEHGSLEHVGVTSSFTAAARRDLVTELAPLRENAREGHPWAAWASGGDGQRMPGGQSRWSAGKDLSWEPLRPERVAEVKYDHLQGARFRHAATFVRWRPDKSPSECRYDQLEVTPPYELAQIFRI
jgi:ATP-dependent DNA ligase